MVERGTGAIVNVASVNAFFQPDAATIDYGAANAALVNLTKRPWPRGDGRRGNRRRHRDGPGEGHRRHRRLCHRPIHDAEVAALITLLISARTANVTGANYVIDGGLIKTT